MATPRSGTLGHTNSYPVVPHHLTAQGLVCVCVSVIVCDCVCVIVCVIVCVCDCVCVIVCVCDCVCVIVCVHLFIY